MDPYDPLESGRAGRRRALQAERRLQPGVAVAVLGGLALLAVSLVGLLLVLGGRAVAPRAPGAADGCGRPLDVAAAPELVPALTELAAAHGSRPGAPACTAVAVRAAVPAELAAVLAPVEPATGGEGAPTVPDVWIPDSSVWVGLAGTDPAAAALLPAERPSIANSPTVVGMPRPMAEALGWPDTRLGWGEILPLMEGQDAWGERGHPEWGPFRLGLADPQRASAGLHAVLSFGAAQSGVWTDALSSERLDDPEVRLPLISLERRIAERGTSVDDQLERARQADQAGSPLQFVSALPLAERDVWRYNLGLGGGAPPTAPLVAVYPADGGLPFDYPFLALPRPAGDPDAERVRAACDAFRDFLLSPQAQARLQADGFRDAARRPGAALLEAEGVQPERAGTELLAPDGPAVRAALDVWAAISRRGTTLAVIDVSGSMAEEAPGTGKTLLEFTVDTAAQGSQLFAADSEVGLWEFSTELPGGAEDGDYRELVPIGPVGEPLGGATRREALVGALRGLQPTNDTALYDTLLAAHGAVQAAWDGDALNTVVLFTDGRSDGDQLDLDTLLARLRERQDPARPVQLVAIAYGDDPPLEELTAITEVTGGTVFTPTSPAQIAEVFLTVLSGA